MFTAESLKMLLDGVQLLHSPIHIGKALFVDCSTQNMEATC